MIAKLSVRTLAPDAVGGLGYAKEILRPRHTLAEVRPFVMRSWRAWPSYSYLVSLSDLADQWVAAGVRRFRKPAAE